MAATPDVLKSVSILMSLPDIWQSLPREHQVEAAKAYFESGETDRSLIDRLSRRIRFRPIALKRQPLAWRAEKLAQNILAEDIVEFLPDLLRSLHLISRKEMLVRFLDGASVPHAEGKLDDDVPAPTAPALEAGLAAILSSYPPFEILTYFRTLLALDSPEEALWVNLSGVAEKMIEALKGGKNPVALPVEPAAEPEEAHESESSEDFTSLDQLLIKTIVASALEIDGAPERAKIDDMTDELIHLNADRKRSFFHRGFFEAVFALDVSVHHVGENSDSRLWCVAGAIMGWVRRREPKRCVDLFCGDGALLTEICNDENPSRLRMLLPVIYPIMRDGGLREAAISLLTHGLPYLNSGKRFQLASKVLDDASALLRDGDAGASLALLNALAEPPIEDPDLPPAIAAFGRRLLRKKAQCLQLLGQMKEAEAGLKMLAEVGDFDESIEALADLGLIVGGFRSLYAVLPGKEKEEQESIASALAKGIEFFEQAVMRDDDGLRSRNAQFALGVFDITKEAPDPARAAGYFDSALMGMIKDAEHYEAGNLLVWARFLLGLSILETCDETRFRAAVDCMRTALKSEVSFPITLWIRCLSASALFDDKSLSVEIAGELLNRRGSEVFDLIRKSGVLEKSSELLSRYADWVSSAPRSVSQRADEWDFIRRESLAHDLIQLAERSLDELESLAHTWDEYADTFLKLLETALAYSPAWEPTDAEEARLRLLEANGRFEEAAELLRKRFWRARADRSPESRADAEGILDDLREMGRPLEDIEALRKSFPETDEAPDEPPEGVDPIETALINGKYVRVLFVGGDERQAKHDEAVRNELASLYPGLKIEFEHPGWGSNWAGLCDQIESDLHDYDAIVLSPLVRTNMGRRLRKMCGEQTPWFACPGKGPQSISRSIAFAARRVSERQKAAPKI